jgi:hypothetical protein
MSIGNAWSYRSPLSKLLHFFRRSRDQWKAKCKEAKRQNKSLKYRLAKMTESRDRWKGEARAGARQSPSEAPRAAAGPPKNRRRGPSRGRRCRPAGLGVAAAR